VTEPLPEPVFVDTNVLVYAHDASEIERRPVAEHLLADLWRTRAGALSTQVLQELYVVATRKYDPPMSRRQARELVDAYGEWHVVQIDVALIVAASQLEERHTLSFSDALIVEAARRAGAARLVTEDLQAGRRFAGVLVDNPFASAS
jgi:predicted nucleic acid-binding protein